MGRAKLSGALLVSKLPPDAGRSVQYLRPVPDDRDAATFGAPSVDQATPQPSGSHPKTAFWFAAIGAVVIAVASVTGLALLLPAGLDGIKPTLSIPLPSAASKLAKATIDAALRVPALRPAALALTSRDSKPASPPQTTQTAAVDAPAPADAATIASAEPPKLPGAPPAAAPVVRSLLRAHGDALFAAGHLAVARDFYRRAADTGDGRAALQLGETYDPAFLALAGLFTERGDMAMAARWYRRAETLDMPIATVLLRGLAAESAARPSR